MARGLQDRAEAFARATRVLREARKLLARSYRDHDAWVTDALLDPDKKWFVAQVVEKNVPHRFLNPMIRAAVYERDPSLNRRFIEPCVRSFGQRQVYDSLLMYVTDGTDSEKAGAINAAYWVRNISRALRHNAERGGMSQSATTDPALDDAKERFRRAMLSEFVVNENVDVRRSIAAILPLDVFGYPDDLKPLVSQAIGIARQHPDGYIRHRVGVQLADVAEPIAIEALPRRAPQAPM